MRCSCVEKDDEIIIVCPDHQRLVKAEREACAKIALGFMGEPLSTFDLATGIAKAIRSR